MIDSLGHPITPGCTVITGAYWSASFSVVTKVLRTTKKRVVVNVSGYEWYQDKNNRWKQRSVTKTVYRDPSKVLVIDKQLNHNRKKYPENIL